MSNAAVGTVFGHIVDEVINSSRVDFEENAVDEKVLQELKKLWQARLSAYNIAQFPWDPKPDQTPTPAALATAQAPPQPSSNAYTQSTLSPQAAAQPLPLPGAYAVNGNSIQPKPEPSEQNGPMIKQEPGSNMTPLPPSFPGGNGAAAQRAAYNLENQYGPRAAASINAIHSGLASQGTPAPPQAQQQPMNAQQQYRQAMAAQTQQQQQQRQLPRTGNLHQAQVDGAGTGEEASARSAPMDRASIDRLLHAQMAARAKELEGGGLLLPLREATRVTAERQAGVKDGPGLAQVDGGGDEDEELHDDSDAINSALDDDSNGEEEEDEEANELTMLCMYDKVQRVKNKWKCVLKDGILNVNGKEYVFHKATGEYEW